MSITSLTVKATGGLHIRVSHGGVMDCVVAALFKKGNGTYARDIDVGTFVGDASSNGRMTRDFRGICQLVLQAAYIDLPDTSAQKVAEFLGIEYPSKNEAMP
jgi:hypothetical protein